MFPLRKKYLQGVREENTTSGGRKAQGYGGGIILNKIYVALIIAFILITVMGIIHGTVKGVIYVTVIGIIYVTVITVIYVPVTAIIYLTAIGIIYVNIMDIIHVTLMDISYVHKSLFVIISVIATAHSHWPYCTMSRCGALTSRCGRG